MDICSGHHLPEAASCSSCHVDFIRLRIHPSSVHHLYEARRRRQHQSADKLLCYLQLAAAVSALLAVWIDHGDILRNPYLLAALTLDIVQTYLLRYHTVLYSKHRSAIITVIHFTRLITHWQGAKANPRATLLHLKVPTPFSHVSVFLLLCKVLFSSGLVQYLPLIYSPIDFHSHLLLQSFTFHHVLSAAAVPLVCALARDGLATPASNMYHLTRFLALPTPPAPAPAPTAAAALLITTPNTCSSSSNSSSGISPASIHPLPTHISNRTCTLPLTQQSLILLVLLLQLLLGFLLPLYLTYMREWQQKVSYLLPQLPAIRTALQQPQQQAGQLVAAAAAASHQKVTQLMRDLQGCSSHKQLQKVLSSRELTDREEHLLLLLLEQDSRKQQQEQAQPQLQYQHQQQGSPQCHQQQQQQVQGQQQQQRGIHGLQPGSDQTQYQGTQQHEAQQEAAADADAGAALPLQWRPAVVLFGYQGGMLQAVLLQVLLLCGLLVVALGVVEGPLGQRLQLMVLQQLQEEWQGCS